MAGFQVANFTFGKNIKDDERQRMAIATQAATARRGQDIQAAQADANREENARQFDARMAETGAARAEGARQFDARMDEGARQFDATQANRDRMMNLQEADFAAKRGDVERAQSWDDALKRQQMEMNEQEMQNRRLAFDEKSAKLDSFLRIKEEEDAQAANRRAAMEDSYGNMAIVAQLQNGVLTKKQVDAFNKELIEGGMLDQGQEYNYIGTIDQTTGKPFSDGKLHFVRYALDGNGRVQIDEASGRPLVEVDNPLNSDVRNAALTSYFGNVKEFMGQSNGRGGANGMSEERMQLERDRLVQRDREEEGRNNRAQAKNNGAQARLAVSVAKYMTDIKRGLKLNDDQAKQFQDSLTNILSDAFSGKTDAGSSETPSDQQTSVPEQSTPETGTKKITGYRYNKDRTKRIPVYEDGSQGEPEDVAH